MAVKKRLRDSSLLFLFILIFSCQGPYPVLRIGLVADPQYQDKDPAGKRYYRESLWKLEEAIDTFNFYKVDLIQNLGDIIDRKWESFDAILPFYQKADPGTEVFHLLGNHDFAVDSAEMPGLLSRLGMPDGYYSYSREGWKFIVLNSMDYSFLANPLELGEQVVVFSHMPLLPEDVEERLWNASQIINILDKSPVVRAYINGHRHKGAYAYQNGIHYISIFGMVDTMVSSYAILEIYKDRIELRGFGGVGRFSLYPVITHP